MPESYIALTGKFLIKMTEENSFSHFYHKKK